MQKTDNSQISENDKIYTNRPIKVKLKVDHKGNYSGDTIRVDDRELISLQDQIGSENFDFVSDDRNNTYTNKQQKTYSTKSSNNKKTK